MFTQEQLSELTQANGFWANEVTALCAAFALGLIPDLDDVEDLTAVLTDDDYEESDMLEVFELLEARGCRLDLLTESELQRVTERFE